MMNEGSVREKSGAIEKKGGFRLRRRSFVRASRLDKSPYCIMKIASIQIEIADLTTCLRSKGKNEQATVNEREKGLSRLSENV
jgi:hypothetical protein